MQLISTSARRQPLTKIAQSTTVFCTVAARNYLPQVATLYASAKLQNPEVRFVALVIDAGPDDEALSRLDRDLEIWTAIDLGLSGIELDNLRGIYDVVELSTAVKPLFFLRLLEKQSRVVYLDPDTYAVSSLTPLDTLVDEHGIVLTPHFREPVPASVKHIADDHTLTTGVYNLGFGAFSRDAAPFLTWWWGKLQRDCLNYPLLGLFVDQKWVDVGATYFGAFALRDAGYNVGPWNLHERELITTAGEVIKVAQTGDLLRLFHFSGFDPEHPRDLSIRLNADLRELSATNPTLENLAAEYASRLLEARHQLGKLPQYAYLSDSVGKTISTRVRRVYRAQLLAGAQPPSLFDPAVSAGAQRWRRSIFLARLGSFTSDGAIAVKYASPDSFRWIRRALGPRFTNIRETLLKRNRIRR
jgi:hypothetical protein